MRSFLLFFFGFLMFLPRFVLDVLVKNRKSRPWSNFTCFLLKNSGAGPNCCRSYENLEKWQSSISWAAEVLPVKFDKMLGSDFHGCFASAIYPEVTRILSQAPGRFIFQYLGLFTSECQGFRVKNLLKIYSDCSV